MNILHDVIHTELLQLINHFILVANSVKGLKRPPDDRIKFSEPLAKKAVSHIISAVNLFEGTKFSLSDKSYIHTVDFSSIAVLTRAAIETYLTFNFILINPIEVEDQVFRFCCWDLAGFIEREEFPALDQKSQDVKNHEIELKAKILKTLESNKYYKNLTKAELNFLNKGNWRLGKSWKDIAIMAGFHEKYFKFLYTYLCSYSHSGRLSILQIDQIKEYDEEKKFAEVFHSINLMIIARLLTDYVLLIPECKKVFESDENMVQITKIAKQLGDNLNL